MSENSTSSYQEQKFWLPWPLTNFASYKTALLSLIFSAIVFSYAIVKIVKDAVFLSMVGASFQPWAKIAVIFVSVIIFMPLYSWAMNRGSRQTLAIAFPVIYAVFLFCFAVLLLHPTIGLTNKVASATRWLGWVSYIFLEFYSIAIVATFWAMLSSISTPESSKQQYGIITIASRVAGILASLVVLWITQIIKSSENVTFPLILVGSGIALLGAAALVKLMFKSLPPEHLTGYTDIYEKTPLEKNKQLPKPGFLDGLRSVLTEPYAIGIFGLIAAVEMISTIMDYRMQCLVSQNVNNSAMGMLYHFGVYTLSFQLVSLVLATFVTTTLPQRIGLRKCLLVTPLALMFMIMLSFGFDTLSMAMAVQIVVRAFNYGFNEPVREMLYVPTSHKIQFGAKGWVDTFGRTLSKGSGAALNLLTTILSPAVGNTLSLVTSMGIGGLWLVIATFVGKSYHQAIAKHQVIGSTIKK